MNINILNEILTKKIDEVESRKLSHSEKDLILKIKNLKKPRGFLQSIENQITNREVAIIAEIKKASPSKGVIRENFSPVELAKNLKEYGATCLSVLTDEFYFQGSDKYLQEIKEMVEIPILRKDFIVDRYQVFESRYIGADAILLIVAALSDEKLKEFTKLAQKLDLDVLIEVHDLEELNRALKLPCRLIGINNRNLKTFKTDINTTIELLDSIPKDQIVVSESGFSNIDDIDLIREKGINVFLIGEILMKNENPGKKMKELFRVKQ